MDAINEAVTKFHGGQTALARELKASRQQVNEWVKGKRPVPPRHALRIEQLTGITRYQLRPDIFGAEPQGKA